MIFATNSTLAISESIQTRSNKIMEVFVYGRNTNLVLSYINNRMFGARIKLPGVSDLVIGIFQNSR